MNAELNIFAYDENMVRTSLDENGEILFVGKDVAKALDYSDCSNTARLFQSVPEEWKGVKPIHTLGGMQEMLTLTEQDCTFLLPRSETKALNFQKWLAGEVLPLSARLAHILWASLPACGRRIYVCSPLAKRLPLPIRKRCLELAVSTHIKTGIDADTLFNTFCTIFYEEEQEGTEQEEQPSDSELLLMRDFFAETCKSAPDFRIRSLVLFKAYGMWYEQKFGMVSCMSHKYFSMLSRKTGLVHRVSTNPYSLFCGMALQADYASASHEQR